MFVSVPILPGVRMAAVQTDKFKTGCFSVNLLRPLCREEAALNALLPSVLLRGTREQPTMRKISAWLDSLYGASAGSFVRKRGEVQTVGFYADFLSDHLTPGGEEILRPMIHFTAGILLRPAMRKGTFLKSYVEGEKTNLVNDIEASLNEKRAYASRQLIRVMCEKEAYGVSRLGEAEEVRAISRDSLLAHWQRILETSRMEIFYLGTEDPERVADMFRSALDGLPRGEALAATETRVVRQAEETRYVREQLDVTQGKLCLGFRTGITGSDPDYPALVLLNAVFGAGTTSKLFTQVREARSLCYYASSGIEKHKGLLTVSAGIDFDRYEEALDAILEQLELCRKGEISDEELSAAKRSLDAGIRMQADAPGALESYYLGQVISGQSETLDALRLRLLAVTKEEIARAAEQLSLDTVYFLEGVGE